MIIIIINKVPPALNATHRSSLTPQSRQYVYLPVDRVTAKKVGAHRGKPAALLVDTKAIRQNEYKFYRFEIMRWLCRKVSRQYLRIERRQPLICSLLIN